MKTEHRIIAADCLEALPLVAEASVDLVLFSPPYDEIRSYGGEWTIDMPSVGTALYRVVKDGGVCVVVIGDGTRDFAKSLTTARLQVDWVDRVGWRLFECCIWERSGQPGGWWNKRFRVDHEYVLIFFKGVRPAAFDKEHMKVPATWAGSSHHGATRQTDGTLRALARGVVADTKCPGTVWKHAKSNTEKRSRKSEHPATFPDALAADIIRCFSREDGLVLDPMCGSGTTNRMAKLHGRNSIGIDMDESYVALATELLAAQGEG